MRYFSGTVAASYGIIEGYVGIENGTVAEVSEGKCPGVPEKQGLISLPFVNCHTHCADGGLRIPEGIGLEELVAPPSGLKHRYLRESSEETLAENMRNFAKTSYGNGIDTFVDFRESGVKGSRLLREAVPGAFILGRPESEEFDPNEIDAILEYADGIALSGISDIPVKFAESVADYVIKKGKTFALHASEAKREDIDAVLSLSPDFLVHMSSAGKPDILKCADAGVPIVSCPRSNRFFGIVPPLALMQECGAEICLGTDNAMLSAPDMRAEAAEFVRVLEVQGGDSSAVWNIMTRNGRKILYDGNRIGLQPGTEADIVILPSEHGGTEGALESAGPVIRIGHAKGRETENGLQ